MGGVAGGSRTAEKGSGPVVGAYEALRDKGDVMGRRRLVGHEDSWAGRSRRGQSCRRERHSKYVRFGGVGARIEMLGSAGCCIVLTWRNRKSPKPLKCRLDNDLIENCHWPGASPTAHLHRRADDHSCPRCGCGWNGKQAMLPRDDFASGVVRICDKQCADGVSLSSSCFGGCIQLLCYLLILCQMHCYWLDAVSDLRSS